MPHVVRGRTNTPLQAQLVRRPAKLPVDPPLCLDPPLCHRHRDRNACGKGWSREGGGGEYRDGVTPLLRELHEGLKGPTRGEDRENVVDSQAKKQSPDRPCREEVCEDPGRGIFSERAGREMEGRPLVCCVPLCLGVDGGWANKRMGVCS